jgi:sigma-E factor negative regulatory protein RseA
MDKALESKKMSATFDDADALRRLMSALADGEADAAGCAQASAAWAAGGAATRGGWHAYHLIGDVLRSEDLAAAPGHDEAFLQRLRLRLADEPAVLAPQLTPVPELVPEWASSIPSSPRAASRSPRPWMFPAALAASVMGLGTVWAVSQWGFSGPATSTAAQLAAAPVPPGHVTAVVAAPSPAIAEAVAVGGKLVRDAQLDRYLRAHREYGAAAPGSLPGGAGRSIETVSLQR